MKKNIPLLVVLLLLISTSSFANTVTVLVNRTVSYLLANNVGGSGTGGKLGTGDDVVVGNSLSVFGTTITLTVDAAATINTLELGNTAVAVTGSNGVLLFSGNYTLTVTNGVALGDNPTTLGGYVNGQIDMTLGGTLKTSTIGTVNSSTSDVGTFSPGTGTIELTGTFLLSDTRYATLNNLRINTAGTTTLGNSALVPARTFTGDVTVVAGTLSANGADMIMAGSFTNSGTFVHTNKTVTFNGTGAQIIAGTTTTTFYNFVVNKPAGTLTQSSATVSVANLLTMTAGIYDVQTNTLSGAGSLTATGGDLQLAKLSVTLPELTGTYNITGGTVTFKGAGSQTVKSGTYYNTVYTGASGTKTLGGSIINNNDLTISSAALLDASASNYQITLVGNWINNSSVATAFIARSATVVFNGNTTVFGTATSTFYKATINSTKTLVGHATNMIIQSDFTNNGIYTHNSGKVTFNGAAATSGRVLGTAITPFYDLSVGTTATYTLVAHPTEMQIAHNLDVNTSTFDANYPAGAGGDGKVTFNGTSLVTLTATIDFNHVKIASGASLTAASTTSTRVFGDWDNNGTFNANTQLINFRSQTATAGTDAVPTGATTRAQFIKGSSVTTFYGLSYNNAAAGATLTMQQSVIVANQLDLRAGGILINKNTLTVQNGLASGSALDQVSGGIIRKGATTSAIGTGIGYLVSEDASLSGLRANNSSYVVWNINANTGVHAFPFGTSGGVFIPLLFNLTAGNTGIVTTATYPTAASNSPYPIGVNQVFDTTGTNTNDAANVVDRFWSLSSTANGTSTVTFTYADAEAPANGEIGSDAMGLRAQQWNGGNSWSKYSSGQIPNTATNTVTVPAIGVLSSGKPWTLALHVKPLPIELLSFAVSPLADHSAKIIWKTATETNNKQFTVQRSKNGVDFEDLYTTNGAGTSLIALNYVTVDKAPLAGTSYYRLYQLDFDGKSSYSGIVVYKNNTAVIQTAAAYPNPFVSVTTITLNASESKTCILEVYDEKGIIVQKRMIETVTGENTVDLDMSEVASGIYYYSIAGNPLEDNKLSGKIIKL